MNETELIARIHELEHELERKDREIEDLKDRIIDLESQLDTIWTV